MFLLMQFVQEPSGVVLGIFRWGVDPFDKGAKMRLKGYYEWK